MSKKLFALIHGGSVHVTANSKVVPAEAFSVLVTAEDILKNVKGDAELYKKETVTECEKIKEVARQEGYDEGFKAWGEHIARLEAEIVKVRHDLEKMVIPVAIKAAKKIVGKEIELSNDTIVDIVSSNLKAVSQHKKITIYVSKSDLSIMELSRERLKNLFENLEVLSLRERSDIKPGGCVIETEGGIINAQLENQWRILETAIETILKPKPKNFEKIEKSEKKEVPKEQS